MKRNDKTLCDCIHLALNAVGFQRWENHRQYIRLDFVFIRLAQYNVQLFQ